MRKIKEILRLKLEANLGYHQIARSCCVSTSTVSDVITRAKNAGLSWPLPQELHDEEVLEEKLYPGKYAPKTRPEPDMHWIHREMKRKGVTLQLLWDEYKQAHPDGYQYSYFCECYQKWRKKQNPTLRQTYRAGEVMFVDYAGKTLPIIDLETGEVQQAQIFVSVLAASNYTYAEAVLSVDLLSWISSHCRAFEYFGGVAELLVPDNPKTGVKYPCRYEPELNRTYQEMASHYGIAVMPARPYKPRDKAKVETGVQIVERWILAKLRNRTLFSLEEANEAIRQALSELNRKPFQKLDGCRLSVFEELEKPALKPLPPIPYEIAQWKKLTVNIDYHVEVDKNYYSVPYQLVKEKVDVRITSSVIEILYKGRRVASHAWLPGKGRFSTLPEHRPASHQKHLEWTPSRIISWAEKTGPHTAKLAQRILESRPHPEQGYRSCLGLIRLGERYGKDRLEAACARALFFKTHSYRSIKSILEKGLDNVPLESPLEPQPVIHVNIRGAGYYEGGRLPC